MCYLKLKSLDNNKVIHPEICFGQVLALQKVVYNLDEKALVSCLEQFLIKIKMLNKAKIYININLDSGR